MLSEKKSVANLKTVAAKVGLAPCSVSAVLNNTPAAKAIPQSTKERIFRAAADLNYRPNLWARSLRTKRTRMIAAVASDFGRASVAQVVAGIQTRLQEMGYLLVLGSGGVSDSAQLCVQLQQRGIEGLIAIDRGVPRSLGLPTAAVELGFEASSEPLTETVRTWLAGAGESAAETIVDQIEQQNGIRTTTIQAKVPPAFFTAPDSTAELGRETA
jgi:hypothetical protein